MNNMIKKMLKILWSKYKDNKIKIKQVIKCIKKIKTFNKINIKFLIKIRILKYPINNSKNNNKILN